ncbi:TetR/AcrR family transcriptional regulator [Streptomyces sp. NPDC050439]|uniref:TetR/AcrR family transcriptional regulator n=1 Tax=unclassified Streptomyces TaxID=2593676 RepID=UPI0034252B54
MSASAPLANRFERRRAETRQALVRAARQILAENGDAAASIQIIANRADVGFGSFYNHFDSKTALFDAAVADALDEYGQLIDELLEGVDDPAELVASGVRLSAQMVRSHPEIANILRRRGIAHIHSDRGLALRALRDLELGVSTGRFTAIDPAIALSVLGGSVLALLELTASRPDLDSAETAATTSELVLRALGLSPEQAREVARRPLPPIDARSS